MSENLILWFDIQKEREFLKRNRNVAKFEFAYILVQCTSRNITTGKKQYNTIKRKCKK